MNMASSRLKTFWYSCLYTGLLLLLLCPLYMYFSHDPEDLKSLYPQVSEKENEVMVELKSKRPQNWAPLSGISRYGKWAIIISEDWSFYQHQGIDVNQIKVALEEMLEDQRFRGASTITQQMVKNVFLSESRTLWRKVHELILAQKTEKLLTKDKILETYLNCIEFGPHIYGIKNASYHYFKKSPKWLSPREAAFLAMLLPSPKRYYVSFKKKHLTPFALKRVNSILDKLRMAKIISRDQYEVQRKSRFSWEIK